MVTKASSVARLQAVSLLLLFGGCTALNSNPLDGGETGGEGGATAVGGHGGGAAGSGGTAGKAGTGGTAGGGGSVAGQGGNVGTGGAAGAGGTTATGGTVGTGGSSSSPVCGNGVKEGTEACDLGSANNTGAYGGCTSTCTLAAYCGDGVVNGTEACDKGTSGNTGAYNGCTSACKLGPYCGDSVVNGSEVCDNGTSNGTAVNNCNPIRSGLVATKRIGLYGTRVAPSFGGATGADAICETAFGSTFRAFIVDGSSRVATVTAFKGDGQVGWVLKKYMQYVTTPGAAVVWTTDASALLGVTNGVAGTLTNPINPTDDGWGAWVGMNSNYTTGSDCVAWSSVLTTDFGLSVNPTATAVGGTFPNNNATSNCAQTRHLICVEQ